MSKENRTRLTIFQQVVGETMPKCMHCTVQQHDKIGGTPRYEKGKIPTILLG